MKNQGPSKTILVSFYTEKPFFYIKANELFCKKHSKLPNKVVTRCVKHTGSRANNTKVKPQFIRDMLKEFDQPIFFVDIDDSIAQVPDVKNIVAIYHKSHTEPILATGLGFAPTKQANQFLDNWEEEIEKNRVVKTGDHQALIRAYKANSFDITKYDANKLGWRWNTAKKEFIDETGPLVCPKCKRRYSEIFEGISIKCQQCSKRMIPYRV